MCVNYIIFHFFAIIVVIATIFVFLLSLGDSWTLGTDRYLLIICNIFVFSRFVGVGDWSISGVYVSKPFAVIKLAAHL